MPCLRVLGAPTPGAWAYAALSALSGDGQAPRPPGFPPGGLPREAHLVLVRSQAEELEETAQALKALGPLFPGTVPPWTLWSEDPQVLCAGQARLSAGARIVLATPAAVEARAWTPRAFRAACLDLRVGGRVRRADLLNRLVQLGYQRTPFVEGPGEYAVRGSVVDLHPLEPARAVRVFLEGDQVENLRSFDPATQSTVEFLQAVQVSPLTPPDVKAGFAPLTSRGTAVLGDVSEGASSSAIEGRLQDWISPESLWLLEEGMGPASGQDCLQVWDLGAKPSLRFGGNLDRTAEWLVGLHGLGYKVFLFCLNRGESERFGELLESRMPAGTFQLMVGPLQRGFQHEGHKLVVVTSSEILERFYRTRSAPLTSRVSGPFRYAELKCGDYVVHQDYGIGRYLGLKGQDGVDCLLIEYRGGDKLYVPLLDFRKVQKYIGAEGKRPRLNSLDTRTWLATLGRVQEGVRKWMEQLLRLEAHRKVARGHAFPPDSYMEGEFARSFPYEETPDQSQAIEEVRAHLQAPYPMDHLLVGDVGFGKTEVAMRAALKCVVDFRQAAVLVPTTILAAQHARTFRDRFAGYPVRIGMLSRFNSRRETLEMLQGLREGTVDIAIGTHRLLQPDVRFKDLGLLVIDEEHRFGVRAKERLRLLKRTVDTLAMTATPIPRTLHQALSGLRSLSRIESPPLGRQPISTWVGPWDEDRVQSAVLEELAREGQVYYVHNRVRTLPARLAALKELLPQVRFGLAHGQMRAQDLDRTLWDFHNRKFDVLVSSSIIESGLDLPAVNTLIVENAQEFGLSELYQLRGRVGRERRQAWCYLFHPTDAGRVGPEGVKRLAALREFADLGSAFRLSLRDMEIRGAGDLLGIRQHGYLSAVGLEFYCELLTDEMNRMRGRLAPSEDLPLVLDLKLPAHIPEAYLPGEMERLDAYKRILACPPARERALQSELEDLSGALPEEVRNLFRLSRLKRLCQSRKLRSVVQRRGWVDVHFRPEASPRPQAVLFAARAAVKSPKPAVVEFLPSRGGDGIRVDLGSDAGQEAVEWLEGFLSRLQEIAARA